MAKINKTIDEFKDKNGQLDWEAYSKYAKETKEREIEDGMWCYKCGAFLFSKGYRQLCMACQKIDQPEGFSHDQFIRCPKCTRAWRPEEREQYEVFQADDDHEVWCYDCDTMFEISTYIQYTFTSPPLLANKTSEKLR
jgi:hypothetical protein